MISLEHYFFFQCYAEEPPLAVLVVKLDLKSDMDLKLHKGSRTKLLTLMVSGRELNPTGLVGKELFGCRLKVLNSCSD